MGPCFGHDRAPEASAAPQPAAAAVNEDDISILDLKAQRDQLVGQRKRVDKLITKDETAAKELIQAGKKQQAMLALRKKKLHEQMILDCENHVSNLDGLIMNIEAAQQQKEIVEALAEGVKTLKKVQQEIGGADYVQQLMDEREDAMAEQQEINEALAAGGIAADDEEALEELRKMEEAHALDIMTANTPEVTAAAVAAAAPVAAAPQEAAPAPAPVVAAPAPARQLVAA